MEANRVKDLLEHCSIEAACAFFGLERTHGPEELEAAFRELARKYHPDKNLHVPGAEERFAHIVATYYRLKEVLGARRPSEDTPAGPCHARHTWYHAPHETPVPAGDAFASCKDLHVTISFLESLTGTTKCVTLKSRPLGGLKKSLFVTIPPLCRTGTVLRLREAGFPPVWGAPPSDLYVEIIVRSDRPCEVRGNNLYIELEVSRRAAERGGTVRLPTPLGMRCVTLPPDLAFGRTVRFPGLGLPSRRRGAPRGDLFARLVPKKPLRRKLRLVAGRIKAALPLPERPDPFLHKNPFLWFREAVTGNGTKKKPTGRPCRRPRFPL